MKKRYVILFMVVFFSLISFVIGKLYIAYNLATYSGYYVQQLPRKEGTNPEMAIILENIDFIELPTEVGLKYNLKAAGTIIKDSNVYLSLVASGFEIWIESSREYYSFNRKDGKFSHYYNSFDIENERNDEKYKQEGEEYLHQILPPILEAQPKPAIDLQYFFNKKYYERFN